MPNHRVSTRLFVVALVCVGVFNCDRAPAEVNVPGKPETWFGTARREDIGHVVDNVDMTPDPLKTFEAHDGKRFSYEGERQPSQGRAFTLKTPKPGRYVFAYGVQTGKDGGVAVRYRSGDKWAQLPPGQIQPDYFRGWDSREFCYWVDIPEGQTTTRFEISGPGRGALIAEPRKDPFEGMPARANETMFALPDVKEFQASDLGRAVLHGVWEGADPSRPMPQVAFDRAIRSLGSYERIGPYLRSQKHAWSVATDGLMHRMSGDKKYARLAGMKAARMATWPTWGYAGEWNVDKSLVADVNRLSRDKKDGSKIRQFGRNHTLSTSILVEIMAIGYDLAYGGMDDKDRLAYRKGLDHFAHLMYVRSYLHPAVFYGGGNWGGHFKACLGLSGAAQSGENRYAKEWMERFSVGMNLYAHALVDPKGIHRETIRYLSFGFNPLALTALAIERRGGPALFKLHGGRVNHLLRTLLYTISPSGQDTRDFGDTGKELEVRKHRGMSGGISSMLAAMTNSDRPELARWAIRRGLHRLSNGDMRLNYARGNVLNVLLYQPGPEKAPSEYDDLPLGWHERCPADYPMDSGYAVMQTGFDSADDIKLLLKCGHSAGGHGHPCQGTFTLDAYGDFLSQPPGYNLWGRNNTHAYNLISIDGEGQAADHAWNEGRSNNDGHIERFVHSPVADICIANNKMAYDGPAYRGRWSNPVKRSLRYFLFVRKPKRRGYFVIVDDMIKDDEEHEYTWNFHTTANHRIGPAGEHSFLAAAMSMDEALKLWKDRGQPKALRRLIAMKEGAAPDGHSWPAPSKKYPWVKEVFVDLRIAMVWPQKFTHKVTYKAPRWKNAKKYYDGSRPSSGDTEGP